MHNSPKMIRFLWRAGRNFLCLTQYGRTLLFPPHQLAMQFGRGDAAYSWQVFKHHWDNLSSAGFHSARRILEIGPGRNLGTCLLWWACSDSGNGLQGNVTCWDVFKNASPETADFWIDTARELLAESAASGLESYPNFEMILGRLAAVASGALQPHIGYRIQPLECLEVDLAGTAEQFDLIYSHAAIEHIWQIERFWDVVRRLTADNGWHSFRIDLADHGRRDSNYVEMLEWPEWAYRITMCCIPGAINRWRAHQHIDKLTSLGMQILTQKREVRHRLPIDRGQLAEPFRNMDEIELRTTAVDIVACLPS